MEHRLFLSTPSARRATRLNFRASSIVGYFYPRPPRGGRRAVHRPLRGREDISIHALREEGDVELYLDDMEHRLFLSTPSARRATSGCWSTPTLRSYFYPRPPRGGRPLLPPLDHADIQFLSTPSARRATAQNWLDRAVEDISIHALREEGDLWQTLTVEAPTFISIHALREEGDCSVSGPAKQAKNFYPRPPRGGRRRRVLLVGESGLFLSTPSARRATP